MFETSKLLVESSTYILRLQYQTAQDVKWVSCMHDRVWFFLGGGKVDKGTLFTGTGAWEKSGLTLTGTSKSWWIISPTLPLALEKKISHWHQWEFLPTNVDSSAGMGDYLCQCRSWRGRIKPSLAMHADPMKTIRILKLDVFPMRHLQCAATKKCITDQVITFHLLPPATGLKQSFWKCITVSDFMWKHVTVQNHNKHIKGLEIILTWYFCASLRYMCQGDTVLQKPYSSTV